MDVYEVLNNPIPTLEHMLGKGCLMPFAPSNSSVRKLMFATNLDQRLPIIDPDVPFVSTGYENQFGYYSSSYEESPNDMLIVGKIPKFKKKPGLHYFLITANGMNLNVIERNEYKHITESYGYMYSNDKLDSLTVGSKIKADEVYRTSKSFDEYYNRKDGKNLLILFNSSEFTMEDGIQISESCAEALSSPLIHKVKIIVNDNDIPLNIYGDNDNYKVIPDIGEYIHKGTLAALRQEKKEESLYSQSFERLQSITLSDLPYLLHGYVVDIDIHCNNPEKIRENAYYKQFNYYYEEHIEFCKTLVGEIDKFLRQGYTLGYELEKLYHNCKVELDGKQFYNERIFSNIDIDITVIEQIPMKTGDKLTNRYGGKGVVSSVVADKLMPKTYDGRTVDIKVNFCGVYGRENGGQLFEMSLTNMAYKIAHAITDEVTTTDQAIKMYLDFLEVVSPSMHEEIQCMFANMSDDEASEFISSIANDSMIYLDVDPMSENMTIDKLAELYKRFPWIEQEYLMVPLENSVGEVKYVKSRRPVTCGYVYYYRLKQYGKEKFSVTSLSATNIKNENSRNKASKVYKARYSRTPIRFGVA